MSAVAVAVFSLMFSSFLFQSLQYINREGVRVLSVGKELEMERMPLRSGRRVYKLQGLKDGTWYEVKISYPASIPAIFNVELVIEAPEVLLGQSRRLLNTEKLIFQANKKELGDKEMHVVVTVEPEGVVAIPDVQEREFVMFNIVCDQLALGIPYKAWWIVFAALLCLVLAAFVPRHLLPYLLPKEDLLPPGQDVTKSS